MSPRIGGAGLATAVTALLLSGCAAQPVNSPSATASATTPVASPTTPDASPTPTETATPTESPTASLSEHNSSALAAIETAETATEGAAFSLDWTRNRWEIELLAGARIHEVYLSADGATVTNQESERAEAEDVRLLSRSKVSMARAITTVVTATPDAMLIEADLDTRRGQVVWEVDITVNNNRQRTYVDAVTGAVT